MKRAIFLIIAFIGFISCNTQKKAASTTPDETTKLVVSYDQTPGMSKETPEYTIELYSNRQMYLTAKKNLDKEGKYLRTLTQNEYNQIITAFNNANFFKFQDEYTSPSTDLPTRYLFFSNNGKEKKVKDYDGAPDQLKELELLIQSFLDRVGWEKMSW